MWASDSVHQRKVKAALDQRKPGAQLPRAYLTIGCDGRKERVLEVDGL